MSDDIEDTEHIITFGYGSELRNRFFVIPNGTNEKAVAKAYRLFDETWGMCYHPPAARKQAGVETFNLVEIK